MPEVLVVASLMSGKSPTGVETHFNQIIERARERGLEALLVSAAAERGPLRRLRTLVARALDGLSVERSIHYEREADAAHLEARLRRLLPKLNGRRTILYAQDPLSARCALRARGRGAARVVMAVHYNVSEADELRAKGLTREGGLLWRAAHATEQAVLPALDHICFVSEFMLHAVSQRVPAMRSVPHSVIPNFPAAPVPAPDARPEGDLIAIGTLEPRKNQSYLLDVLAACKQRGHTYTLTIAGDGPDRDRLTQQAQALGLAQQVRFLGHWPQASRLLPSHRVLVHAARMENLALSLVEALSYGRPVLAAGVGGIPEVVRDGVEGLHWPLDDPDGGALMLIRMLEEPEEWKRMSERALRAYAERFSPAMLSERWMLALRGVRAS